MYIFNFHHVEPRPRHESRKHITITPQGLGRFIRFIRWMGMEPVSLRDVIAQGGPQMFGPKAVVLTFDDGYENFYHYAAPVLEQEKCPATVFVLAGKFSGNNDWDQDHMVVPERDALMSLDQMKELGKSQYITLGSHGMHHRNCTQLTSEELHTVFNESYEILSKELEGAFIPVFAYPWGAYNHKVLDVMMQSPYVYGFTSEKGLWKPDSQRFSIPRYSIYYRDGNPLILLAKFLRNNIPLNSGFLRPAAHSTGPAEETKALNL